MFKRLLKNGYKGEISSSVICDVDINQWQEHLFGLTQDRWDSLKNKSFWVTGAGTGYGRSLACSLAASGAEVFLTGRRIEKLKESLQELSREFNIDSNNCHLIPADLSKPNEIFKACEIISNKTSMLHGLINCAALPSKPGVQFPLENNTVEDWQEIMDVNVRAAWLITKTIFPHFRKSKSARVILMTSEAGWSGTQGFGLYNISKAAVNSLGYSMAMEYAAAYPDMDIQINIVSPGQARTEMNKASAISPYSVVSLILILLTQHAGGPNGKYFHRDGRHLSFCDSARYPKKLN